MVRRFLVIACAVLSASATHAWGQDTEFVTRSGGRPLIRPDGTYMFSFGMYDLVFEGQIAPRIIIVDSIGDAARALNNDDGVSAFGWQLSATPMVRLRMFNEPSNPVRTPSYMPKGTLQLAWLRNVSKKPRANRAEFSEGPVRMWLVDIIPFGHHSNGQDNCLFLPRSEQAGGGCAREEFEEGAEVNRIDGSFSTNYVEASVHYSRMRLRADDVLVGRTPPDGSPEGEYAPLQEWRVGLGVTHHMSKGPGGIKPALAERYGTTRVFMEAAFAQRRIWWFGRLDAVGRLEHLRAPGLPRFIAKLDVTALPRRWGGAGVFVRYYRGQDYYNLAFSESIHCVTFGFALQRDTFLSFAPRTRRD